MCLSCADKKQKKGRSPGGKEEVEPFSTERKKTKKDKKSGKKKRRWLFPSTQGEKKEEVMKGGRKGREYGDVSPSRNGSNKREMVQASVPFSSGRKKKKKQQGR